MAEAGGQRVAEVGVARFAARARAALSRPRTAALAAAGVALVVYAGALANGFAYDDVIVIQEQDALHTLGGVLGAWTRPYWPGNFGQDVGAWRPITSTWWGLQWLAWGDDPLLFHAVAVLLHSVATALVVLLFARLLPPLAAGLGGLLFALHPVHVEAVANVVGSADVAATVWVLAAALVHMGGGERYGWGRSLAIGALYLGGLLTKESAVVLPGLLVLLDAARRDVRVADAGHYLARRWRPFGLLVLVLACYLLARADVLGQLAPPQLPFGAGLFDDVPRIWAVAALWPHYVRLMVLPLDLAADYGGLIHIPLGWTAANVTGVVLALGFLILAAWTWRTGPALTPGRSSRRIVGLGVMWFVVAVSPVANVLFISPVLVAERNLYLPSVAVAAAGGWLLSHVLRSRRRAGMALVLGVSALFAVRTVTYVPAWNDTYGLFAELLERHPGSGRAWFHVGHHLFMEGHQPEARQAFSALLAISGSRYSAATEVGVRLSSMDGASPKAAEFLLERAWREHPEYYTAPWYLAVHHLNHGRYLEGLPPARAAVILAPENADMHRVLGSLLSGAGRPAQAIPHRLRAFREGGDGWRARVWLAEDYAAVGDTAAARDALAAAREQAADTLARREVASATKRLLGPDTDTSESRSP